jgi:hypothetical protein
MNIFLFIFIFCLILFLYLHVFYHLKISKDLEVYSVVNPNKTKLEEICNIRQPVVFTLEEPILKDLNLEHIQKNYGAFDVNVISYETDETNNNNYMSSVPFILNEAFEFLNIDSEENNKGFISCKNKDFIQETTLIKKFKKDDYILRPPMVSVCDYDIIMGCKNSKTKLLYELNYRNYFMCLDGRVTIRVVSPTYKKYMDHQNNYLDFEFYSPLNVWDIQPQYKNDFDKVKTMDITLNKGDVAYIPAYWYYSIHFEDLSSLASFKYRTYMNNIAILPELCMYFLQNNNVKHKTYVKYDKNSENKRNENK